MPTAHIYTKGLPCGTVILAKSRVVAEELADDDNYMHSKRVDNKIAPIIQR